MSPSREDVLITNADVFDKSAIDVEMVGLEATESSALLSSVKETLPGLPLSVPVE